MDIAAARLDEAVLPLVTKPNRYQSPFSGPIVPEFNRAAARVCLLSPVARETGLARPGIHTLLSALLDAAPGSGALVDLVFAPAADFEARIRSEGIPLYGLAARRPLNDYDALLVLCDSPLELPDLVNMLELGGVKARSADRGHGDPLVFLAGSVTLAPACGEPFADACLVGDAEAFAAGIMAAAAKRRSADDDAARADALGALAGKPGVHLPVGKMKPPAANGNGGAPEPVEARWLEEPPSTFPPGSPAAESAHGLAVEIARPRGPRDPVWAPDSLRFRSPESVVADVEATLAATGQGQIVLTPGDAGAHPGLVAILETLNRRFAGLGLQLRLDDLDPRGLQPAVARELRKGQRTRLVLGPVAPSARLREAVGRPLTRDGLIEAAATAARGGWATLKFRVLLGLPGEGEADREEWLETMESIREFKTKGVTAPRLALEVVPFVPRPHTRGEREAPVDPVSFSEIVSVWRSRLARRKIKVTAGSPAAAVAEAALLRGDARGAEVVEALAHGGARHQTDFEAFDPPAWQEALSRFGAGHPAGGGDRETTPWAPIVLDTPPWRRDGGESHERTDAAAGPAGAGSSSTGFDAPTWTVGRRPRRAGRGRVGRQADRYRLRFSKTEPMRFTAHLDVTRAFERAFRRVQLPVAHSQGKDRRPKISFGPPLPLGMTSAAEYLDVTLSREVSEQFIPLVNDALPEGLAVQAAAPIRTEPDSLNSAIDGADYEISFSDTLISTAFGGMEFDALRERLHRKVADAVASRTFEVTRVRSEDSRTFNARPSLIGAEVGRDDGGRPLLTLRLTLNRTDSVRPELLTATLCDWADFDERLLRVHRRGLHISGRNEFLDPLEVVAPDFAWWSQPVRGGTAR